MAARRYAGDHSFFGEEEGAMEQSQMDEDEDDWGLSSSSPSSSSPAPPAPPSSNLRHPITALPSSPECSMDDDSSTDGEDLETSHAKRRVTASLQQANSRQTQATTVQQRRAMIKELQVKTQQECMALCRALLPLQQQWRQELEDPIPGLITYKEEERKKRKDISSSRSETHLRSSLVKMQSSAGPINQSNMGN